MINEENPVADFSDGSYAFFGDSQLILEKGDERVYLYGIGVGGSLHLRDIINFILSLPRDRWPADLLREMQEIIPRL